MASLQASSAPLSVAEVAERVRLHPNTARFHLDGLVAQGWAERAREDREVPGRPRALYTAKERSPQIGRRSYQLLAQILTSYLASSTKQPEKAALKAGQEWGRFLSERPMPFERVDAATATQQLVRSLDEVGFAPEPVVERRQRKILLHHCPFREAAEQHSNVVCTIHLGLMRGVLEELDAPLETRKLEPFVEPDLCVAHLAQHGPARRA